MSVKKCSTTHKSDGITILFEDKDIIVIDKPSGLLTIANDSERNKTAYYILTDYVKKGNYKSRNRVFIVHRLDKDTSGVIVFAKNEESKRFLQDEWQSFRKQYFAVVHGVLKNKEDIITSYLTENKIHRMYSVSDPNLGKIAKTGYKVFKESSLYSLLKIDLYTGRKNQIRVQFANIGHPIVGDNMYGRDGKEIARLGLHCGALTIRHPHTKEDITFMAEIPKYFKVLMKKN